MTDPAVFPRDQADAGESDHGAKKFAREFDARVLGRHAHLRHREILFAEDVLVKSRTRPHHLDEAGEGRDHEEPAGNRAETDRHEEHPDRKVKDKPEGGVDY